MAPVCPPLQLEHHIHEFRTSQDRLAEVREKYKQGSSSVNDLARELAQVSHTPSHTTHLHTHVADGDSL